MKSVLLYVNDDSGLKARLQSALDLTRAFNGHLHCLRANPYRPQMAFDGVTGVGVMYDMRKYAQETDAKLRSFIEEQLKDEGVAWDYQETNHDAALGIAKNSALADLIILSSASGKKDDNISMAMLGDILFDCRAPVIVQPDSVHKFDASGPAVVAWNGSLESGNALRAAIPLLQLSSDVHILTVDEKNRDYDLPSLAASEYLSRHGIKSEVHAPKSSKASVQATLLSAVDALEASYMVMGAYGHSKARQFIFGGVTRSLFRDCPVPLFVSH